MRKQPTLYGTVREINEVIRAYQEGKTYDAGDGTRAAIRQVIVNFTADHKMDVIVKLTNGKKVRILEK
jgi:hypothetical protein